MALDELFFNTLKEMEWKHGYREFYELDREHPDMVKVQTLAKNISRFAVGIPKFERTEKIGRSGKWTKEEEDYLVLTHGHYPNEQIGKMLDRPEQSVRNKVGVLKARGLLDKSKYEGILYAK